MMSPIARFTQTPLGLLGGAFLLLCFTTGCATFDDSEFREFAASYEANIIPHELSKATAPIYVIEPPDVLTITAISRKKRRFPGNELSDSTAI